MITLNDKYNSIVNRLFMENDRRQNLNPNLVSVTDLIGSLKRLSFKKRVEFDYEIGDVYKAFLGTAIHSYLEQLLSDADGIDTEFKISAQIEDIQLRGVVDAINHKEKQILDYKTTSVYKYIFADYTSFEKQLNLYRYMLYLTDSKYADYSLNAILFFTDYSAKEATRKEDYPQLPIVEIEVPTWDFNKTAQYIDGRIKLYKQINALDNTALGSLDICSPEEKMMRNGTGKYAVIKKGRKTAVRVFDNQQEAEYYAGKDPAYEVEYRAPKANCVDYCPVSKLGLCKFAELEKEKEK